MNVLEAIYSRRSFRKFKTNLVPDSMIEIILDAAVQAPSAMNRQPWRFVVLAGKKKEELAGLFSKKISWLRGAGGALATAEILRKAPLVILVFNAASHNNMLIKLFSTAYDVLFIQSIGAAIQNINLAALGSGLGTLWVGHVHYASREIARFCGSKNN